MALGRATASQLQRSPALVLSKGQVSTAGTLANMTMHGLAGAADLAAADIPHGRRMRVIRSAAAAVEACGGEGGEDAIARAAERGLGSVSSIEHALVLRVVRRLRALQVMEGARDVARSMREPLSPVRWGGTLPGRGGRGAAPEDGEDGGVTASMASLVSRSEADAVDAAAPAGVGSRASGAAASVRTLLRATRMMQTGVAPPMSMVLRAVGLGGGGGTASDEEADEADLRALADRDAAEAALAGRYGLVAKGLSDAVKRFTSGAGVRSRIDTAPVLARVSPRRKGSKPPTVFHGSILTTDVDAAADLFLRFDADGSGEVDANEFLDSGLWEGQGGSGGRGALSGSVFNTLDVDGNGTISLREYLRAVFSSKLKSADQLRDIVEYAAERGQRKVQRAHRQLEAALAEQGKGDAGSDSDSGSEAAERDRQERFGAIWSRVAGPRASVLFADVLDSLAGSAKGPPGETAVAVAARAVRRQEHQASLLRAAGAAGVDADGPIDFDAFVKMLSSTGGADAGEQP